MKKINIEKLPDSIDPNMIIKNKIKDEYGSKCPFCGEEEEYNLLTNKGIGSLIYRYWYGKYNASFFSDFKFWEKSYHYQQDRYRCWTCGGEWYTPPYPTDVLNQEEMNKIFEKIFI